MKFQLIDCGPVSKKTKGQSFGFFTENGIYPWIYLYQ